MSRLAVRVWLSVAVLAALCVCPSLGTTDTCSFSWSLKTNSGMTSTASGTISRAYQTCASGVLTGRTPQLNGQSIDQCGFSSGTVNGSVSISGSHQYNGVHALRNSEVGDYFMDVQCNLATGYPWAMSNQGIDFGFYYGSRNQLVNFKLLALQNYLSASGNTYAPFSYTINGYQDTLLNGVGNFTLCCDNFATPDGCYGPTTWPHPTVTLNTCAPAWCKDTHHASSSSSTGGWHKASSSSSGNHKSLSSSAPSSTAPRHSSTSTPSRTSAPASSSSSSKYHPAGTSPINIPLSSSSAPPISVRGDPAFVGLRGQSYQIHGVDGAVYNIVSERLLQVNSRFVFLTGPRACPVMASTGKRSSACWKHDGSYLADVGLMTDAGDRLYVESGGAETGFATVTLNGRSLKPAQGVAVPFNVSAAGGSVPGHVTYHNSHELTVHAGVWTMELESSDYFINLRSVAISCKLSELASHGLLGQTWRSNARGGAVKVIEGSVGDYVVLEDDVWGTHFVYNQFQVNKDKEEEEDAKDGGEQ